MARGDSRRICSPGRGRGLRRLSLVPAAHRRRAASDSMLCPRAECGDGPRQPRCWPAVADRRRLVLSDARAPACRREPRQKLGHTGNPVREIVLAASAPLPIGAAAPTSRFSLLVFGGSQGARFFAEFMPKVMRPLPKAVRKTLTVVQQCRAEDLKRVRAAYARARASHAELAAVLSPTCRSASPTPHLVICRSGASTIAELGVIGRPAVLVPLPHAIDNDQLRNAESFTRRGGGWLPPAGELHADEFAAFLTRLRYQESDLQTPAAAARAWQARRGRAARRSRRAPRRAGHANATEARIRHHETSARCWTHSFHRHRRHRHERHRRGHGDARLHVQGSDLSDNYNVARLRKNGIPAVIGHRAANLGDAQVVVVSSAVKADNPELVEARDRVSCRSCGAPRCWPS